MKFKTIFNALVWVSILFVGSTSDSFAQKKKTFNLLSKKNAPQWRGYGSKTLPPGWMLSNNMLWVDNDKVNEKVNDVSYKGSRDIIFSGREFEYFELSIDWKIGKGGNSGIFYHVKEGYGGPSNISPEYQLIDDENYARMHSNLKDYNAQFGAKHPEQLQDWQKTGADYAMHPADESKKVLHPAGEWNTTKIVVAPGSIEHWLNGVKIVSFNPDSEDWKARKNAGKWAKNNNYGKFKSGYIGLQYHGSSLWFRNIKINSLQ